MLRLETSCSSGLVRVMFCASVVVPRASRIDKASSFPRSASFLSIATHSRSLLTLLPLSFPFSLHSNFLSCCLRFFVFLFQSSPHVSRRMSSSSPRAAPQPPSPRPRPRRPLRASHPRRLQGHPRSHPSGRPESRPRRAWPRRARRRLRRTQRVAAMRMRAERARTARMRGSSRSSTRSAGESCV